MDDINISLVSNQSDDFKDILNESRVSNSLQFKLSNIKFELNNDLVIYKGRVHIFRKNKQENVIMYLLKSLTLALVNVKKVVSYENCIISSYVISPTCYIFNCDKNITYFVSPIDILCFKVDDYTNNKKWKDLINESIQRSTYQLYEAIDNNIPEKMMQYEDYRVVNITLSNIDALISNIVQVNEWAIIKSSELKGLTAGSQIYEVNNATYLKTFQDTIELIKQSKHIIKLTLRRAISKQGYLLQHDDKSIRFHFWLTKFIVLRHGSVKVYENHRQINQLKSIQLQGSILVLLPYNMYDKLYCFRVTSFDGNILSFRCSDEIQLKDWSISISHAIAIANGGCYIRKYPLVSMNQFQSYDPNKSDTIIQSNDFTVNNNDIISDDYIESININANTSDSVCTSDIFTPITISTDEIKQMSIRTQFDGEISKDNIDGNIQVNTSDELFVKESNELLNHEICLNVFNHNKDDEVNDVSICTLFNDIYDNTNTLTNECDNVNSENNNNIHSGIIISDNISPMDELNINQDSYFSPQSMSNVSSNQSMKRESKHEFLDKNILCADNNSDLLEFSDLPLTEVTYDTTYQEMNKDSDEAIVNENDNSNPQINSSVNDITGNINLENNLNDIVTDSNYMIENQSNQMDSVIYDMFYSYNMNTEHQGMLGEDKISAIQSNYIIDFVSDGNVITTNQDFPVNLNINDNQTSADKIVEIVTGSGNLDIINSDLVNNERTEDDEKNHQDNEIYSYGENEDSFIDLNDPFIENTYREANTFYTLPNVLDDEPIDSSKLIFTSDSGSR